MNHDEAVKAQEFLKTHAHQSVEAAAAIATVNAIERLIDKVEELRQALPEVWNFGGRSRPSDRGGAP